MKGEMNTIPFQGRRRINEFQAAEKLHVTRSAVAKAISRLEDRLGVTLFNRTTRRQSLTDEGSLYYEACRRALDDISSAEDMLEGGKLRASGKLRVSVPVLFSDSTVFHL